MASWTTVSARTVLLIPGKTLSQSLVPGVPGRSRTSVIWVGQTPVLGYFNLGLVSRLYWGSTARKRPTTLYLLASKTTPVAASVSIERKVLAVFFVTPCKKCRPK